MKIRPTHCVRRVLLAAALLSCSRAAPTPGDPQPGLAKRSPVQARPLQSRTDGGESETLSRRESARIARVLAKVSALRELAAKREVPAKVLSRESLLACVKEHVAREVPTAAITHEGEILSLLGMIPKSFDYQAATYALLEAQLAGFYDPSLETMFMAADLDEDNAEATLAHELVHALQDQHYNLKETSKYRSGESDRATALSALAEGDATSTMIDVLLANAKTNKTALDLPEDLFAQQVMGSVNLGPGSEAPRIMRASLIAPYIEGTMFVHAVRRRGGFSALNKVWDAPPTTSEQILHIEKWDHGERAIVIETPSPAALGTEWSVLDADTYGELGIRLAFEEWMSAEKARDIASQWGGDRGALVTDGSAQAFIWRIRYDDAPRPLKDLPAARAFKTIGTAWRTRFMPKTLHTGPTFLCTDRGDLGALSVQGGKTELIFTAGLTERDTSPCARAKKWSDAVARTPSTVTN